MKNLILALLAVSATFGSKVYAKEYGIRFVDLDAMAKESMTEELVRFNDAYVRNDSTSIKEYKQKYFDFLRNQFFKKHTLPGFLFNKCTMTSETVDAVASDDLDAPNDLVGPTLRRVSNVKDVLGYGKTMWELTYTLCNFSRERFVEKLKNAKSNGQPLSLSEKQIANLSRIVFFPTIYGKETKHQKAQPAIAIALTLALATGSAISMGGVVWAGAIISLSVIGSSIFAVKDNLPKAENKLAHLDFRSFNKVHVDEWLQIDKASSVAPALHPSQEWLDNL